MKILVVGSGPSSFATMLNLLKTNHEIYLIDNSEQFEDDFDKCIFSENFRNGNRIPENTNIFDLQEFNFENDGPYPSKIFGGYSNVWGGTLFEPTKSEVELYNSLDIDILKYFKLIKKNLYTAGCNLNNNLVQINQTKREKMIFSALKNFESEISDTHFSEICINPANPYLNNLNKICKDCNGIMWACRQDTIWTTKSFFNKLINDKRINYITNFKLKSLRETIGNSEVICLVENNNIQQELTFDKVFIAAGPIGTSKIIMNSSDIKAIEVRSCDMLSLPFFKLSFSKSKDHTFADIFSFLKISNTEIFMQIYGYSRNLLKISLGVVPFIKYLKFLPDIFFSSFGGMFVYFDQNISSSIQLIKNNEKINIKIKDKSKINKSLINKLSKHLLKSKIIPLNFISKKFYFGRSNHMGGQFYHSTNKTGVSSDRLGRILGFQNVHIIDSSVLPIINVGPITAVTMANSYRISEEIIYH